MLLRPTYHKIPPLLSRLLQLNPSRRSQPLRGNGVIFLRLLDGTGTLLKRYSAKIAMVYLLLQHNPLQYLRRSR
jgi:hypothetical protein